VSKPNPRYFVSDLDPSGLDLQRAWEEALANFHAPIAAVVRIGLTRAQVIEHGLDRLAIAVKPSDSRTAILSPNMATAAGRPTSCRPLYRTDLGRAHHILAQSRAMEATRSRNRTSALSSLGDRHLRDQ
jgi:hypothetical protein